MNSIRYILLGLALSLFLGFAFSQTTTTLNSGAGNFTVPCNVTSITVDCWGGGGGGGGDNTNGGNRGNGGGGGGYSSSVMAVTPGQVIAYSVGTGGAGGASGGGAGGNGTATTFGALTANPGTGGGGPAGAAGAGGSGSTANGAAGTAGTGTGAGGAAGGAGGGAGGTAVAGGNAGNAGAAPGGGGSGGNDNSIVFNYAGGAGGAGRITITYTIAGAGADQNLAACATSGTLAATAPASGTGTWTCVTNCTGVIINSPNSATSTFSGLTVPNATTFRWTVSGAGCTSTTDDVVINTVSGALCPTSYCTEGTMSCTADDGITNVTFATIGAASTPCTNGSASCAIVTAGSTYPISVTSGAGSGNHSLAVYCDWNSDGDWADAGEFTLVANNNMTANSTRSGNITVPAGATCGATIRMRVLYVYSSVPTAANSCANFSFGETEDYCLVISCCTPNCANGIQDCNEQGVDCGGPCGSPCAGVPSCTNSIQDQDETGVDCGGLICAPCGVPCSTFSGATATPAAVSSGGIVDATGGNQTISTCVNVTYSNRGTNWLHGVFVNPASTGFVSSSGVGALPEPNYSTIGTTYRWRALSNNFTGNTSGNSITQDGWYVVTGAADNNPGDNLGWPDGAGTTFGPFCFETVVSCAGLDGDVNAFINFQTTGDSYSGSWTNIDCGKETSFGANSFSYTLRCPSVLPVEFLEFDARFVGRIVKVNWSTLSEFNSDYYEVYKSNDGTFFEKMETVKAAGNSSFKREYASYDVNPSNKITYYKIKQYDMDGNKKETKTIGLIMPLQVQDISVVPNPVSALSSITFNASKKEMNWVTITDISGKIILQEEIEVNDGANVYSFNTNDLNPGIYFLQLSNETDNKKVKFIKSNN